jgi:hypothetical protein
VDLGMEQAWRPFYLHIVVMVVEAVQKQWSVFPGFTVVWQSAGSGVFTPTLPFPLSQNRIIWPLPLLLKLQNAGEKGKRMTSIVC